MELELKIIKMTTTFEIFVLEGKKMKKSSAKNKKTREEKDIKRKKR